MNKPTRKTVLQSVRKAERLAQKASHAANEADAMVATYWKSTMRPWVLSQDIEKAASLSYSLTMALRLLLEHDVNSEVI